MQHAIAAVADEAEAFRETSGAKNDRMRPRPTITRATIFERKDLLCLFIFIPTMRSQFQEGIDCDTV
jgi:hypothetical protein